MNVWVLVITDVSDNTSVKVFARQADALAEPFVWFEREDGTFAGDSGAGEYGELRECAIIGRLEAV